MILLAHGIKVSAMESESLFDISILHGALDALDQECRCEREILTGMQMNEGGNEVI